MGSAPRLYRPHEIAQTLGRLKRLADGSTNAYVGQTLCDSAAILVQLAATAAVLAHVLSEARRWASDHDGACLLPETIDSEARQALASANGLGALARSDRPTKGTSR